MCDRAEWTQELENIKTEMREAIVPPDRPELKKDHVDLEMSRCLFQWLRDFRDAGHSVEGIRSLEERWLADLSGWPEPQHGWVEQAVLEWGEKLLPDYIAEFEDGEAEYLADYAFADLVENFPRVHLQRRRRALERKLQMQNPPTLLPHRPVRRGHANTVERRATWQRVPSMFEQQEEWQAEIKMVKTGQRTTSTLLGP